MPKKLASMKRKRKREKSSPKMLSQEGNGRRREGKKDGSGRRREGGRQRGRKKERKDSR